jgi:hypothetical protein
MKRAKPSQAAAAAAKQQKSGGATGEWLRKALTRRSRWERKDDLLDAVYWARQVVSVLLGLVFGFVPITGVLGFML